MHTQTPMGAGRRYPEGVHLSEEGTMEILAELDQVLTTIGSKVETKLVERVKHCGIASLEGINATTNIPPQAIYG